MLLKIYHQLKNRETGTIITLILLSVFLRIPVVLIYGDTSLDHEWKHLVQNLIVHGQLVYENFDDFLLPNLWMPPLYAYYLYIFSFFGLEDQNYILLVLLSQIFLSSISIVIFYKINKLFFTKKMSFYSSVLFSVIPLHVYASSQISSITLQVFSYLLFIYLFFKICRRQKKVLIFTFSILAGLILLLRSEFQAIFILSIIYLFIFFKVSIKKILFILLISAITISPYMIRNYLIFEKITLAETFGYNLWKGNHPHAMKNSLVEGYEFPKDLSEETVLDENMRKQSPKLIDGFIILEAIPRDINYRLNFNNFFLEQAIYNISKEPVSYLIFFFKKVLSFLLIDIKSSSPNYYNPLHYLPILILGITSLFGIALSSKKSRELNYLIMILFAFVFIFSTVSILPRYKLIILPLQIIFTNIFIERVKKIYDKKSKIK
tara:strand:+ start:12318 stop:13619 length:1302 start_codon:yes stop_codon:yes gene_type:complete